MSKTVVFDSNVWEQIADEAKRADAPPAIQALYAQITTHAITPFFFEGIVNLEGKRMGNTPCVDQPGIH